jgi:hypothetical protein
MGSLEFLGLLNNSRNIDYRLARPEATIKAKEESTKISEGINLSARKEVLSKFAVIENEKTKNDSRIKQEEIINQLNKSKMKILDDMLIDAAVTQNVYEKYRTDPMIRVIEGELFFFYV